MEYKPNHIYSWDVGTSLRRSNPDKAVLEPRVSPENTSKFVDAATVFAKTWTKGHWPLYNLWPHICWGLMCDSTKDHCVQDPWKYIKVCGYSDLLWKKNLYQRSLTPWWPLNPRSIEVTCVTLPKDHRVQDPWKYIKVCGYSDPFCKNLNQSSLTPIWPLTPHLLKSSVWLYPRIIVSKSHENTSKYEDTVTFFVKILKQRLLTPDDLWPHICWGHMCDTT